MKVGHLFATAGLFARAFIHVLVHIIREEEAKNDCIADSTGISHNNCNMKSASGGASSWFDLLLVFSLVGNAVM